jgi:hypothetical protein
VESRQWDFGCARQSRRSGDKDQGIHVNGRANIVPSTPAAIAFRRTPQEVLHEEFCLLVESDGLLKPCRVKWRSLKRIGVSFR